MGNSRRSGRTRAPKRCSGERAEGLHRIEVVTPRAILPVPNHRTVSLSPPGSKRSPIHSNEWYPLQP